MIVLKKYEPRDKMIDIISDNNNLLQVMCRFGISFGFGDNTVEEVCEDNEVDCRTFLAVVNYMESGYTRLEDDVEKLSIPTLIKYLKESHSYFLNYELPKIGNQLKSALDQNNQLAKIILQFYDEYMVEIRKHMKYEEKTVFPYVDTLLNNETVPNYAIKVFSKHHGKADKKLTELKNVMIKYLPDDKERNNLLANTLYDIYRSEEWISGHGLVEDNILVPAIKKLEDRANGLIDPTALNPSLFRAANDGPEALSEREKDVIKCLVQGLLNKEIADRLNISIHTVITHRRNIARKLQIHSAAGLTIYAIVNKLVDIAAVKL